MDAWHASTRGVLNLWDIIWQLISFSFVNLWEKLRRLESKLRKYKQFRLIAHSEKNYGILCIIKYIQTRTISMWRHIDKSNFFLPNNAVFKAFLKNYQCDCTCLIMLLNVLCSSCVFSVSFRLFVIMLFSLVINYSCGKIQDNLEFNAYWYRWLDTCL